LLTAFKQRGIALNLVVSAAAAGVRFAGIDTAFLGAYRADNPKTGVPAEADEGFAVVVTSAARNADSATASELDALIHRSWHLHDYLNAPGLIRRGEKLSRRIVIKHMANEMGGVHIEKNTTSSVRALLVDAESKLLIEAKTGALRTFDDSLFPSSCWCEHTEASP
jgi:hypothetical protein